jgi:hypothetical protein
MHSEDRHPHSNHSVYCIEAKSSTLALYSISSIEVRSSPKSYMQPLSCPRTSFVLRVSRMAHNESFSWQGSQYKMLRFKRFKCSYLVFTLHLADFSPASIQHIWIRQSLCNFTVMDLQKLDLIGKVALITGGTRGICRGVAQRLASRGCSLLITCSTPASLTHVASLQSDIDKIFGDNTRGARPSVTRIVADFYKHDCARKIADALSESFEN